MSTISDPIRERISALQLSHEIVSHLSECTLLLEGCRGALHAIDSNIYSDKMADARSKPLSGEMGAAMNNELTAMFFSVLLFAAMGIMCADALVNECFDPNPTIMAGGGYGNRP